MTEKQNNFVRSLISLFQKPSTQTVEEKKEIEVEEKPKRGFALHPENINRKGRKPKGATFAEYLREFIEEDDEGKKKSIIEEMTEEAVKQAKRGSFQFWDAIVNRSYGKVAEKVEINPEEKPDLSKLTKEEIETWKRLLEKSKPKP